MVGGVAFCILCVLIGRAFFVRDGAKAFDLVAWGLRLAALVSCLFAADQLFEVDRMRVLTAADVDVTTLPEARPQLRAMPWTRPKVIAAVPPTQPDEVLRSINLALGGIDISMIPKQWRDYASQKDPVLRRARPVAELQEKYPAASSALAKVAEHAGKPLDLLRFLPVTTRDSSTVAVIDPADARVVGFLAFDGFF